MSLFGGIGIGGTPFGPLGGSLGSFFGSGQGGNLKSLFDQMQREQALRYTQAQGAQLAGLRSLTQGYDQALGTTSATGLASKMNIENQGAQRGAAIGANLNSRGLGNTSLSSGLASANTGSTAQALAGVDQAVAAARANLLTSKGQAINAAQGGLSGLYQNQSGAETGLGQMAWQRLASMPTQYQQLMQLFGAAGQFLPMLGGMGGTGAAAGMPGAAGYGGTTFPGMFG